MADNVIIPQNEWIMPCNPSYDLNGAFAKLKRIDWRQVMSMKNAKVGDIVYFYRSAPISEICFKGAIINVQKPEATIDDREFGGGGSGVFGCTYLEVAAFREYSIPKVLTFAALRENGLKASLMGPMKVSGQLLDYLHKIDVEQRNLDRFDEIPDTCLVPFPIKISEGLDDIEVEKNGDEIMYSVDVDLNTILYGPPGTGKTYSTMIYAVAIVENVPVEKIAAEAQGLEGYRNVKKRYQEYCQNKRIAFTTFHQSYGYEEFIEGIRPVMANEVDDSTDEASTKNLEYELRSGVFKRFIDDSKSLMSIEEGNTAAEYNIDRDAVIWKISLEGAGKNPTRTDCLENGYIRIGWDQYGPDIDRIEPGTDGLDILKRFKDELKIGDIVLSCYSKRTIDAIGVVTGEYEYLDKFDYYNRARKVKWIVKNINEDIIDINGGKILTLATLYKLKNIALNDIIDIIRKYNQQETVKRRKDGNFVMIIDEINRGNISKIFGELITLIETTKREGADEEMSVILPYSQKPFTIPKNVYILGTMNTADRSIALMDTALRRRFSFREMMPKPELLHGCYIEADGKKLDLEAMLNKINERVSYLYDREHTIGHAFFMKLRNPQNATIENLANIFSDSVIPLLQEYFYEDYNKIQLVLGDNGKENDCKMILETPVSNKKLFAKNLEKNSKIRIPDIDDDECTYVVQTSALLNIDSYIGIYE